MELIRVNATLDKQLLRMVDQYAESMLEDRSTAIRQLLSRSIIEMKKKEVLDAFKKQKITIRQAAGLLGVDYWEIQTMLADAGIAITDLTDREIEKRKKAILKLP